MNFYSNPITKTLTNSTIKLQNKNTVVAVAVRSTHIRDDYSVGEYSNSKRYLLLCKSCHWHTQYTSQSGNQLDMSDSVGTCPICRTKSIKSSIFPFDAKILIR
jgi:hypothetical protein